MLSVIIPAREEQYLEKTLRNILENAEGEIEIIVELDGWLPDPQIHIEDDRVKFVHHEEVIGQRAAINHGVSICKGKYIMKLDAHCAVDKGFDVKLAADCEPDWTVIPRMYNLDIATWKPKLHKKTDYMYITAPDAEKPFRAMYYSGNQKPKSEKLIDETMCNMGPGWFMHKEQFLKQGGCDEKHEGGWGQQGIEVSLKAWLSGGKLIVNKKTWFAHWFRGGVKQHNGRKGFPYQISGSQIERVRKYSRDLWLNDKWEGAVRPLQWLIDKFNPPGWNERKDLTVLFYTANRVSQRILDPVVRSIQRFNYPIVSVSQEPMELGRNFVVPKESSLQNIYRQVLRAAKEAKTKYVALCEDDCLYTKEHFLYTPKDKPFAYNLNRWLLHLDKETYSYRERPILSQCIAEREKLIEVLEAREKRGNIPDKYCGEMGVFDSKLGVVDYGHETFTTPNPNLVICHGDSTNRKIKLLGKDAPPSKDIPHWGDINYWLRKFKPRKGSPENHTSVSNLKQDTPVLKRQVSYIHGKPYKIRDILNNLEWFWDYRKMVRLPLYKHCIQFFQDIHDGVEFKTDDEFRAHPYYDYLLTGWTEPKNEKIESRCLFHMKDGVTLYHDIKENGMKAPLEAWRDEKRGKINIHRGLRRLAIKKALGHQVVPVRLFKNREILEKLQEDPTTYEPNSICDLAVQQFTKESYRGTDKLWIHNYTPAYDLHLADKRDKYKKILEIGVSHGGSLLLWHEVFPDAKIYGVDKDTSRARLVKHLPRVTLLQGMQGDNKFFKEKVIPEGKWDLIVDDCSHLASHQKETLELLWDSVEPGGMYVIEDLYWRGSTDKVCMDKLKDMIDELSDKLEIESVHFYYNIVFIGKRL